jgi:hypothetical protein
MPLAGASQSKEPVDYVNPNIGTIGHLLTATTPFVQYPHGMVRLAPMTTPGMEDRYLADRIIGFPAGPVMLMAATSPVVADRTAYASGYDHDFETATPYYYKVRLDDSGIEAECTATAQAAYYRFTLATGAPSHLVLSMTHDSQFEVVGPAAMAGSQQHEGVRSYFYAEFSQPIGGYRTWNGGVMSQQVRQSGDDIGLVTGVVIPGTAVEIRVGLSYISAEQARANLKREVPRWSFAEIKAQTRAVWNQALGTDNVLAIRLSGDESLVDEPEFTLGSGRMKLGSWTYNGLPYFTGSAAYEREIDIPASYAGKRLLLDCGDVGVVAQVLVNGQSAGVRVWLPFRFDIGKLVRPGENTIRIVVTNAMDNERAVENHADKLDQIKLNGLLGPVRILPYADVEIECSREPVQTVSK